MRFWSFEINWFIELSWFFPWGYSSRKADFFFFFLRKILFWVFGWKHFNWSWVELMFFSCLNLLKIIFCSKCNLFKITSSNYKVWLWNKESFCNQFRASVKEVYSIVDWMTSTLNISIVGLMSGCTCFYTSIQRSVRFP